jgi:hypothetical protein
MKTSKMTVGGVSTCPTGTEQYEYYTTTIRRKRVRLCQYDYRLPNGKLFSTVRPTLIECRALRNEWLKTQ